MKYNILKHLPLTQKSLSLFFLIYCIALSGFVYGNIFSVRFFYDLGGITLLFKDFIIPSSALFILLVIMLVFCYFKKPFILFYLLPTVIWTLPYPLDVLKNMIEPHSFSNTMINVAAISLFVIYVVVFVMVLIYFVESVLNISIIKKSVREKLIESGADEELLSDAFSSSRKALKLVENTTLITGMVVAICFTFYLVLGGGLGWQKALLCGFLVFTFVVVWFGCRYQFASYLLCGFSALLAYLPFAHIHKVGEFALLYNIILIAVSLFLVAANTTWYFLIRDSLIFNRQMAIKQRLKSI